MLKIILISLLALFIPKISSAGCMDISKNFSDEKETKIIVELLKEYERGGNTLLKECAECCGDDKYLGFVIPLIQYWKDKNADHFLDTLAKRKEYYESLWELNNKIPQYGDEDFPKVLKEGMLSYYILDEVYYLMADGNSKALKLFYQIGKVAHCHDIGYIETLELDLFEKHPESVIKNWKLFKKYRENFESKIFEVYGEEKKIEVIKYYKEAPKKIGADPKVCKDIISVIEKMYENL